MSFAAAPLVSDIANKLQALEASGASQIDMKPARALRDALMLNGYTQGYTLGEVAEPFGLTRERARQLIARIVGPKKVKRLPTRYKRSEKARAEDRARGLHQRVTGERQRNPERNQTIEALVATGLSYAEVANRIGVTRNVVCTVIYRANHRADSLADGRKYPRHPGDTRPTKRHAHEHGAGESHRLR